MLVRCWLSRRISDLPKHVRPVRIRILSCEIRTAFRRAIFRTNMDKFVYVGISAFMKDLLLLVGHNTTKFIVRIV